MRAAISVGPSIRNLERRDWNHQNANNTKSLDLGKKKEKRKDVRGDMRSRPCPTHPKRSRSLKAKSIPQLGCKTNQGISLRFQLFGTCPPREPAPLADSI